MKGEGHSTCKMVAGSVIGRRDMPPYETKAPLSSNCVATCAMDGVDEESTRAKKAGHDGDQASFNPTTDPPEPAPNEPPKHGWIGEGASMITLRIHTGLLHRNRTRLALAKESHAARSRAPRTPSSGMLVSKTVSDEIDARRRHTIRVFVESLATVIQR